ncbi:uncharacterized protein LOC132706532 isoform X2 [Cylas formicarius]|uniref:uncharacterized protein LOC132706532 isoform X2 n=1 Tax=Cylas formicarius TaxID=197179 RepID=UPI002958576F|nr:uncharacterized protein LOC132706532 isoform X2 [Cylas formicarius]
MSASRKREFYKSIFEKFDRDGSGTIEFGELREMLKSDDEVPRKIVKKVFKISDRDDDGRIDLDEFIAMVENEKFEGLFRGYLKNYVNFIVPRHRRRGGAPRLLKPRGRSALSTTNTTYDAEEGFSEEEGAYEQNYSCCPPPVALVVISAVEIACFLVDELSEPGSTSAGNGVTAKMFVYDPFKRNECWRFLTYMFVHIGRQWRARFQIHPSDGELDRPNIARRAARDGEPVVARVGCLLRGRRGRVPRHFDHGPHVLLGRRQRRRLRYNNSTRLQHYNELQRDELPRHTTEHPGDSDNRGCRYGDPQSLLLEDRPEYRLRGSPGWCYGRFSGGHLGAQKRRAHRQGEVSLVGRVRLLRATDGHGRDTERRLDRPFSLTASLSIYASQKRVVALQQNMHTIFYVVYICNY